jgi:hypothetical protein
LRGLIAAGLRSGRLPQVLDEYATLVRRQQTYRRQASLVLIYPAILSCIMAGLMLYFQYVFMSCTLGEHCSFVSLRGSERIDYTQRLRRVVMRSRNLRLSGLLC